jgi:hypothetical protein
LKIIKFFLITSLLIIIFGFSHQVVFAQDTSAGLTVGADQPCPDGMIKIGAAAPGAPNCLPQRTAFPEYISMIYTLSITLAIALGVIMVVYGGYKYITSSGNPETLAEAKEIILGAIVGLVLLVLAALLLRTISPNIINIS